MYKLLKEVNNFADGTKTEKVYGASKEENGIVTSFIFDPANTDYQQFKKDVLAGAELQDADGNVMTQEQADDFIKELP
jgi:hypothetical protein